MNYLVKSKCHFSPKGVTTQLLSCHLCGCKIIRILLQCMSTYTCGPAQEIRCRAVNRNLKRRRFGRTSGLPAQFMLNAY